MTSYMDKANNAGAVAGGISEEVLYALKTVSSFGNNEYEIKRYNQSLKKELAVGYRRSFVLSAIFGVLSSVLVLGFMLEACYAPRLLRDSIIYHDDSFKPYYVLLILGIYYYLVYGILQIVPDIKAIIYSGFASNEYYELKDKILNTPEIKDTADPACLSGTIKYDNVTFAYPNAPDKIIYDKISFSIESGKTTAIVGPSGTGKSTLVYLLERLYDVNDGSISIGGTNINKFSNKTLRSSMGYVPQEPMLFNISIKENILMGRNFSDAQINAACEKALVNTFLGQLDKGLDTIVGVKGSKLSGGQKQRVAIARAIINNPKILILDEATSALDNISEQEVQKAIMNLSEKMTIIIIAHRLNTIKDADKIIVVKDKNLAEEGTHDELIKKEGVYFNLIKEQLNKDVDALIEEEKIKDKESSSKLSKKQQILQEKESKISKKSAEQQQEEQAEEKLELSKVENLLGLMKKRKKSVVLAAISSIFAGIYWPLQGLLVSKFVTDYLASTPLSQLTSGNWVYIVLYATASVTLGIVTFLQ